MGTGKIPYTNYRGIGDISGDEVWLPLDPTYKLTNLQTEEDIYKLLNIDEYYDVV